MREIVALRRLFFLFFDLMCIATGRPVGPIIAINGSNAHPLAITSFYFPYFYPNVGGGVV